MASKYRFEIISDRSFYEAMVADAASTPDELKVERLPVEKNLIKLGLDFSDIEHARIIFEAFVTLVGVAAKIYEWLKASKASKAIVKTPFGTLELTKTERLTKEDVHNFLKAAMKT